MAPPQINRLRDKGLIDRKKVLGFNFDGTRLTGHPGDTLASALLVNGVRLVGRSFKYHRPRGILTAGSEEPNALVELRLNARREPNTRATTVELYDGLNAEPEPLAVAEIRSSVGEPAGHARLRRGLLLQDVHVAGIVLGEGLRAHDPPRRRSGARREPPRPGPLREDQCVLRRAGHRRRRRGAVDGARRRQGWRARDPVR